MTNIRILKPVAILLALAVASALPGPRVLRAQTLPGVAGPGDLPGLPDLGLGLDNEVKKKTINLPDGPWKQLIDQPYFKDVPDIKAQKLLFHGQYEEAEILCNDLLKKPDLPDAKRQMLTETRLEAIFMQGGDINLHRFETQAAALTSARMIRLRAQEMVQTGKLADAMTLLKTYVDSHKSPGDADAFAVYNLYGQTLESKARYGDAIVVYTKVAAVGEKEMPEDAAFQTQVANATLRAAILSDQGTGISKHARQIAQGMYNTVLSIDTTYWPAQLELTRLYITGQNSKDAGASINLVLGLNPYNMDVRLMLLDARIRNQDFKNAQATLDDLKAINETPLVTAYEGFLLLRQGHPEAARVPLQRALAKDPNLLLARGWLAGSYLVRDQADKAQEQIDAVKTADRTPNPIVLFEAGDSLRNVLLLRASLKYYKAASDEAGWWSLPYICLGQVYLDLSEFDQSQRYYDKGFSLDSYGMGAVNQLRLLQIEKSRDVIETPHFIIRYQGPAKPTAEDPNPAPQFSDKVLAQLAGDVAEKAYADLTTKFKSKPDEKTQLEFYPSHEEFSVRAAGVTEYSANGISAENVISMDVPRPGPQQDGNYDWAVVLRHEYTHVVLAKLTNYHVPRWLTEAAAVHEEYATRDWDTSRFMSSAYCAGAFFTLDDLNFKLNPSGAPRDVRLAYAESEFLYDYLLKTYGQEKMLVFLNAFRDGSSDAEAFQAAYAKPRDAIYADFMKWAGEQFKSWSLPYQPFGKLEDAKAAAARNPTDVVAEAALVAALINANQLPDAEKAARELVKQAPDNLDAREQLATVLVAAKKADAKEVLEALVKEAPDRPGVNRMLGQLATADHDPNTAARYFEKLQQLLPMDDTSGRSLAGFYLGRKDNKNAIIQLEKLSGHESKDARIPRLTGQLLLDDNQLADAQDYAARALHIDPYSALNHQLMAKILLAQGHPKDAAVYFGYATDLEPKTPEFWVNLADACGAAGDKAAAAAAARKAVELDPASAAKKWIQ